MRSVNFVVLGDYSIASELGKKGTESDITIYDRKSRDSIYTFIAPTSFPEKIQPLIQSINMAEYAILNVKALDKYLGESIIALDLLNVRNGFILTSDIIDIDQLKNLIKDTSLANFEFVDMDGLKRRLDKIDVIKREGDLLINIDHAFDVRGVGAVVLGIVREGKVRVYDEVQIMPLEKNVMIRSIQLHGDNVQEAASPARVGLALKGIKADEITRGDMITKPNRLRKSNKLLIKFEKSKFFNEELNEKHMYMLALGLQVKPVKIKFDNEIVSEKEIAYKEGDIGLLLKPDSKVNRIVGKVIIEE
ncbi:MAG: elongation factor Tu [Candidatus Nitrosothermus koennekii]|nr:MAG: elongation factor Tu [Candidatus Nitrosothermus koennekii]